MSLTTDTGVALSNWQVRQNLNDGAVDPSGEIARRIRSASGDYTPPADACASFKIVYEDLKRFELHLHEHAHLQNEALFPPANQAESAVL